LSRAAVVLRDEERRVALIRRAHERHTYFTFPGGDVRDGEQPADAAVREAREELGVRVVLGPRLLIEELRGQTSHYYSAVVVGGELGTGSDDPVWMELEELPHYDVRPRALAAILAGG
jgi:ADP-ribose pyrophosphatase YjhB (NUDIX family)